MVEVVVVVGGRVPPEVHQLQNDGHTYLIPVQNEHPLAPAPAAPPEPQKLSYCLGAPLQPLASARHRPELGSGEPL